MKSLKHIIRFLGGITFAIILLAVTAVLIIFGTIVESITDSHLYASSLTYSHPFFFLLLCGFFTNILISALRRWPFQKKHIPFLITHFGLLMIIAGCIVKNGYGIQGNMRLMEGSGGDHIFIPDVQSLVIEKRNPRNLEEIQSQQYLISSETRTLTPLNPSLFEGLKIQLAGLIPHSSENWDTWFKGDSLYINGYHPFKVATVSSFTHLEALPSPHTIALPGYEERPWRLYALRASEPLEMIKKIIGESLIISLQNSLTESTLQRIPLSEATAVNKTTISATLALPERFDSEASPAMLSLKIRYPDSSLTKESILPLSGARSLEEHAPYQPVPLKEPLSLKLEGMPTLAFIEDDGGDVTLLFISETGAIQTQFFPEGKGQSLFVYDEGFGGYTVHAPLPERNRNFTTRDLEKTKIYALGIPLREEIDQQKQLAPPLSLLQDGCDKAGIDFVETLLLFLDHWKRSDLWVADGDLPLPQSVAAAFSNIHWKSLDPQTVKAGLWACYILEKLQNKIMTGQDMLAALEELNWPLIDRLNDLRKQTGPIQSDEFILLSDALIHQIFLIAEQLPEIPLPEVIPPQLGSTLLSVFFRSYSLGLQEILPPLDDNTLALSQEKFLKASLLYEELHTEFPPLRSMHLSEKIKLLDSLPSEHPLYEKVWQAYNRHFDSQEVAGKLRPKSIGSLLIKTLPILPLNINELDWKRVSKKFEEESAALETSITPRYKGEMPKKKLEDNIPLAIIEASEGSKRQSIPLAFSPSGAGLKWPLLYGEYRARFQPQLLEIPYHIRLRNARQVNYANSQQPFSYECDLIITDRKSGQTIEKTLSMNNVYQTSDGYRFYLAAIIPPDQTKVKQAQIVVNFDPAKYYLTYPGGFIVAIGIILLFRMHSKKVRP